MNRSITPAWLALWAALLLSGCATLPQVDRKPIASSAIDASKQTTLGRIATRLPARSPVLGLSLDAAGHLLARRARAAGAPRRGLARRAVLPHRQRRDRPLAAARAARRGRARRARAAAGRRLLHRRRGRAALALAAHATSRCGCSTPSAACASAASSSASLASVGDWKRVNHRMHNKLFVADGAMAVIGGRNVANEYFLRARRRTSSTSTCSRRLHRPDRSRRYSTATGTATPSTRCTP